LDGDGLLKRPADTFALSSTSDAGTDEHSLPGWLSKEVLLGTLGGLALLDLALYLLEPLRGPKRLIVLGGGTAAAAAFVLYDGLFVELSQAYRIALAGISAGIGLAVIALLLVLLAAGRWIYAGFKEDRDAPGAVPTPSRGKATAWSAQSSPGVGEPWGLQAQACCFPPAA
jgi:hypothetical protein